MSNASEPNDRDGPPSHGGTYSLLERCLGLGCAIVLFAMMLLTSIDVVGRYILTRPIPGGYQVVALMMGVLMFAALPLLARRNEHLSTGLFDHLFKARAAQVKFGLISLITAIGLGLLAWRLWEYGEYMLKTGEILETIEVRIGLVSQIMGGFAGAAALAGLYFALRHLIGRFGAED